MDCIFRRICKSLKEKRNPLLIVTSTPYLCHAVIVFDTIHLEVIRNIKCWRGQNAFFH